MNAAKVTVIWPSTMTKAEVADIGTITSQDMRDIGRAFADAVEQVCIGSRHSEAIERHQILLVVEVEASTVLRCGSFGAPEV